MDIPPTVLTTVNYVLAQCGGPEKALWKRHVRIPQATNVEILVNIQRPTIHRVADAERELCDIAGFVVTKLVADGNYDPLFPEDWVAEQADDGTTFEIILLEKGYAKELRGISSPSLLQHVISALRHSGTGDVQRWAEKRTFMYDKGPSIPKRPRAEACAVESSSASCASKSLSDPGYDSSSNVTGEISTTGESCSQSRSHSLVSLGQASPSSTAHVNTSVRPATMSHTQQYVGDQGCCSTRLLNAAALSSHVDDEEHYEEVAGLASVSAVETDDELFDDIDPQEFNSVTEAETDLCSVIDAMVEDESSSPFRAPRKDRKVEGRYGVIKPICFEDIYVRLAAGLYTDLAKFRDDMGRLFTNARIFFSEKSVQFQHSLKLHGLFVKLATPLFRRHGYCCADTYLLPTQRIVCAKCAFPVEWGSWWYRPIDASAGTKIGLCHLCFDQGTMLPNIIFSDGSEVPRADFERICHNKAENEPMLPCAMCNREFHAACVGFMRIDPARKFICDQCGGTPTEPTARADAIPHTQMSRFIEEKVNDFLQKHITLTAGQKTPGRVLVRVAAAQKASIRRGTSMKQIYGEREFPYVHRAVYAFQETSDGNEVCFFAFHAQEYDGSCPPPNRGHVYLSYLDSVKFFRPVVMRTEVYHQILFAYMDWVRERGFVRLNLWSLPPRLSKRGGESYLFPSRAAGHKVMTRNMLLSWYDELFTSAMENGIVKEKTTALQAYSSSIRSAADVPYFGGDILSDRLDKASNAVEMGARGGKSRCDADAVVKRFLTGHKRLHQEHLVVDLAPTRIIEDMTNGLARSVQPDADPLFSCHVVTDTQEFFKRCAEQSLSFSTRRLAKFATKHLVHWINTDRKPTNSTDSARHSLRANFFIRTASSASVM